MPASQSRPTRSGEGEPIPVSDIVGAEVRVTARRGYVVEGTCLDVWSLRNGGMAVKIKPSDGSAPREVTTVQAVVVLSPVRRVK